MRMRLLMGLLLVASCGEADQDPSSGDAAEELPTPDRVAVEVGPADQAAPADTRQPPDLGAEDVELDVATEVLAVLDLPLMPDHVVLQDDMPAAAEVAVEEEPEQDAPDPPSPDVVFVPDHPDVPLADRPDLAFADLPDGELLDAPDASAPPDRPAADAPSAPDLVEVAVSTDRPLEVPDVVDVPPSPDVPPPVDVGMADRPDVRTCGARGLACCPGRVCDALLGCSAANQCVPCGARGQPCCLSGGSLCPSDLTCRSSSFTCECGNSGELCCPGYTCNMVSGLSLTCRVVGTRRLCG